MDFDVIPFDDIKGNWKKLGSGSFGNVYKGTYLGIDVAIKEVLPSTEYDVAKYFEREWRLMKEARHPNVVLYLGLSRAPPPDNRIFIISEFIENGNLRIYIHDKTKPFPWRLRLSFATDIARALAYLHARKCIHRDLKGENLLVTANGRLKITDFGFARIAARNAEESKRLTFCGTDAYMSPEILLGHEFDLPTDIFSLGVIFCEILARKLADDVTFKRTPPSFGIDSDEVKLLASPGAPADFIQLAIDCCKETPSQRPNMAEVMSRLRAIELEVLSRPSETDDFHVGSVKLFAGGVGAKRPSKAPRMPSFSGSKTPKKEEAGKTSGGDSTPEETSEDEELMQAVMGLKRVKLSSEDSSGSSTNWSEMTVKAGGQPKPFANATDSLLMNHAHVNGQGHARDAVGSRSSDLADEPLLGSKISYTDYSTSVVRPGGAAPPSLSSILTVKQSPAISKSEIPHVPTTDSLISIESFHTAPSESRIAPSLAMATEGGSTIRSDGAPSALLHRFTLIKPGAGGKRSSGSASVFPSPSQQHSAVSWSPFDFFFSSGLVAKCDLCAKRLGWKPVLECDDCGLKAHIKCGEFAPRDCGLREGTTGLPMIPPLSKTKANGKQQSTR